MLISSTIFPVLFGLASTAVFATNNSALKDEAGPAPTPKRLVASGQGAVRILFKDTWLTPAATVTSAHPLLEIVAAMTGCASDPAFRLPVQIKRGKSKDAKGCTAFETAILAAAAAVGLPNKDTPIATHQVIKFLVRDMGTKPEDIASDRATLQRAVQTARAMQNPPWALIQIISVKLAELSDSPVSAGFGPLDQATEVIGKATPWVAIWLKPTVPPHMTSTSRALPCPDNSALGSR